MRSVDTQYFLIIYMLFRSKVRGLAQMYLADPRFGEYYNTRAGDTAVEILVKIIEKYANQ